MLHAIYGPLFKREKNNCGKESLYKTAIKPALFELCTIKSALELPVILSIYQKPAGNPPENAAAGFRRVSGGFRTIRH